MKRILIALIVVMTSCSLSWAQKESSSLKVTNGKTQITVTDNNTAEEASEIADSIYHADSLASENESTEDIKFTKLTTTDFGDSIFDNSIGTNALIAIVAIVTIFGLPVFIVFVVFFFRYKNRRARYRLAEQALAAGQPLPDNFFKDYKPTDMASQGIRNTFTGIGLFIFLWAITGHFGIGTIGLLVMFMGLGQWLIGYNQKKNTKIQNFGKDKNEE